MTQNKTLNTQLMKTKIHIKIVLAMLFLIASNISNINAQVAFDTVPNSTLRINGELKIIANSIVGLNQNLRNSDCRTTLGVAYSPNDDYDGRCWNNSYNDSSFRRTFGYIDVDGDASTFSSSSATLDIRPPAAAQCERIAYAGLYWAASYFGDLDSDDDAIYTGLPLPDNRPDFRTIKIRHESQAGYTTIPATQTQVIYDGYRNTATNPSNNAAIDIPYVCYADVTSILQGLADPQGEYTVADMRASIGKAPLNSNGISGGWVLVVAYEDPQLSAKYISTTNGYLVIAPGDPARTFDYSNFETLPAPLPVRARYAIATLEGDQPFTGDVFQVRNTGGTQTDIFTSPANPAGNFFDSSITVDGNYVTTRNPASENTLGFDADIFDIPNPGNTVIGNNQTSAQFTTTSAGDAYSVFFSSFQIEVIEPELTVTKRVLDVNGIDITGDPVNFADQLFYELTIENQGNEDITAATIRDVLPANVDFTLGSITTSNPGITATPAAGNRQIDITINDNLIVRNGGIHTVRFGVEVVATCADLRDACSNQINNVAISTYTGVESGITKSGEESILEQDACRFDVVGSSNVLVNDGICFSESQPAFICTGSLTLTAGAGFTNYSWENTANPGVVIGTNQSLDVTVGGIYQVTKTGAPGCQDGVETFEVDAFNTVDNPLINIAGGLGTNPNVNGNVRTCTVTGEELPEIFLCGAGTTLDIDSGFTTATAIEWQRLDPAACSSVTRDENCPTTDAACEPEWVTVGTGINFTLSQAGEYRINATFDSNCTIPFYFNAFQNNFDPDLVVVEQIICGNPGTLRVQNSSNQYEYQLVLPSGATTAYQASAEFNGLTQVGTYAVNVRQIGGLPTACIFQDTVFLDELDANENVQAFSPLCPGDQGRIEITVTDSQINYTYTINSTTGTFNDSEGPTTLPNHTFNGLNPDTYDVQVISADGSCSEPFTITIDPAATFSATIALIEDLRCNPDYQPNPNLNDPTHPDFDPSAPPFDPDRDIAIYEVIVTGGTGTPPSFAFNDQMDFLGTNLLPEAGTTYRFRATAAGNYPVYVSDNATNCVVFAGSVNVTDYVPVEATATPINPTCNSDLGAIRVDITAGFAEGPFTYILNGGTPSEVRIGPSNNTTETFNNVDPNVSHTVTVEDQFGCDFTVTPDVTFTTPGAIVATIDDDFRLLSCTATPDAQAQITAISGGSGSYEWSLNPAGPFTAVGAIPFEIDFATSGSFTLYIRDQAGTCVESFPITIDPRLEVDSVSITPGNQNCANQTVDVVVSALPALTAPTIYEFSITPDPATGSAGTGTTAFSTTTNYTFTNGISYTVTARRSDNECTNTGTFAGTAVPEIEITSATQDRPVTCVGDNDGELSFTVANSTSFDYTVTGPAPATTVIFSATGVATPTVNLVGTAGTPLVAGTYTITVTDTSLASGNCTDTATVDITEPTTALSFTAAVDEADCGNPTGTITVTAVGGRGGYQYELRDAAGTGVIVAYQSSNVFSGLAPATYTVFVRDNSDPALACEFDDQVIVPVTGPPTLALNDGGDECYTPADPATQWIVITPTETPVGPFTYSLNGGAPVAVTFLASPPAPNATTFEIPNLSPGNYDVTVTNTASTCTSAVISFTINPELTVTANLTKDLTCAPTADATVEFSATGGDGTYTFDIIDSGGGVFSANVTSVASINTPDTYTIRVTDGENCTASSAPFIVTPYEALAGSLAPIQPICSTDTGGITVTLTAGEGPFTYVLDQGTANEVTVGPIAATSNTFNGVDASVAHNVIVRDQFGCELSLGPISLTPPGAITATIDDDFRLLSCTATPGAQAQVIAITGGSGTYEFSLNPAGPFTPVGAIPFEIDFAGDGSFTVYIRNVGGTCVESFPITIDPRLEVDSVSITPGDQDCTNQTVDVVVSALPVLTAPTVYEFSITPDPATGSAGTGTTAFSTTTNYTFTNGISYTVTARRSDNECTNTGTFAGTAVPEIEITSATQDRPVTCVGDNDGELSFTVANSTSFDYTVTGPAPATTVIFSATGVATPTVNLVGTAGTPLVAGTYTITVTDTSLASGNCTDTATVDITEPTTALSFTAAVDEADCGNPTGTITVTAVGGRGGYQYELRDAAGTGVIVAYQSSNVFSGLAPATYTVFVRDNSDPALACEFDDQVIVPVTGPPTLALNDGGDECYTPADPATQWIVITPTETPVGPFTYSLNGGAPVAVTFLASPPAPNATTFEIPNLSPGNYDVTVTNTASTCTSAVISFTINPELTVTANLTKDLDCSASPDATVSFSATGGDSTYTFDILLAGTSTVFSSGVTSPASINAAGNYEIRVTDGEGCTALSAPITVNPTVTPTATTAATPVLCFGESTGSITITPTAGEGPFEARILPAGTFTSNLTFSNLAAGSYDFEIRDAKECLSATITETVTESPQITATIDNIIDIDCSTNITGTIVLNAATGGSAGITDYTYILLNNDLTQNTRTTTNPQNLAVGTGPTFDNLDAGSYFVNIVGSDGCSNQVGPFAVAQPPFDLDFDATPVPTDCSSGATYQITVTGGEGPFLINEFRTSPPTSTIPPYEALNGELGGVSAPLPNAFGNETRHEFTGLDYGTPYVFEIIDTASGCRYFEAVPVVNPPGFDVVIDNTDPANCFGDTNGEVTFTVTTSATTVDWEIFNSDTGVSTTISGTLTSPVFTATAGGLGEGNYFVRVVETSGAAIPCTDAAPFRITQPATPLTLAFVNATATNCNTPLSTVTMDANGGVAPYSFAAVAGAAPQPDPGVYPLTNTFDLDPTTSTTWVIFVEDANDCVVSREITIPPFTPAPVINTIDAFVDDACTFDNNYTFTVTATSNVVIPPGAGTLTFALDGGAQVAGTSTGPNTATIDFTVSGPGTYTVVAFDENGCPSTPETITVFPELSVTATITEPTCRDNDATIIATVTGGSDFATNPGNFTFDLVDAGTGTSIAGVTQTAGPGANQLTFSSTVAGTDGIFPGDYRVEVTDSAINTAPGCTATVEITVPTFLDPIPTGRPTPVNCNGGNDGSILVELDPSADDNPPYTYEITAGPLTRPAQANPLFENLPAGTYDIVVTSDKGCTNTPAIQVVVTEPAAALNVVPSQSLYACDAMNDGVFPVITLTITVGTAPYDVSYTGPSSSGSETDVADADGTAAGVQYEITAPVPGNYAIDVIDENNCAIATLNVVVPDFPIMTDPTVTRDTSAVNGGVISCTNPETVIVSITGGTGPFDFVENGGTATPVTQTVAAGTGDDLGTPEVETIAIFTLPAVGSYVFTITDQTTTCTIDTPAYDIAEFDTIEATIAPLTNVGCNGDTTGEVTLTVTGYTGTYDYVATNTTSGATVNSTGEDTAAGPITISGLGAGDIVVTVTATATPFCDDDSNTVTITEPEPLTLALDDATFPNCNTPLSTVTMIADGGVTPYEFAFAAGTLVPGPPPPTPGAFPETNTFSLDPGVSLDWVVFVRDANGCITPEQITIPPFTPAPVINTIDAFVDDACTFDNNYTFTVTATSNVVIPPGAGTLTFALDGGAQVAGTSTGPNTATIDFTVSGPGTYTVVAFDENGCPSTPETITVFPELSVTATITEPTCRDNDATIIATVTGGSDFATNPGNFTFDLVDAGTGTSIAGVTQTAGPGANQLTFSSTVAGTDGIFPGDYRVEVTDSAINTAPGCTATVEITVPTFLDPIPTGRPTPVNCNGGNDGSILVELDPSADDNPPYTYEITAGPLTRPAQANPLFENLPAGTYDIVVTSDKGCTNTPAIQVVVTEPAAALNVVPSQSLYACDAMNDGVFPVITLTITGGTAPYDVSYTGPSSSGSETDVADADGTAAGVQYEITAPVPGNYAIDVIDENNCAIATLNVVVPDFPIMTDPTVTRDTSAVNGGVISCTNPETVIVSITGGTGPFDFVENGGTATPVTQTVAAGTGDDLGTPEVETIAIFTLPAVGSYVFTITDQTTTCTIDTPAYDIAEFDTIEAEITLGNDITCFNTTPPDGSVNLIVTGYTGSYTFDATNTTTGTIVSGAGDTTTDPAIGLNIPGLEAGNIVVTVTATNTPFCDADSNTQAITLPPVITVTANQIRDESCNPPAPGGDDALIEAVASGGTGTLEYQLEDAGGGILVPFGTDPRFGDFGLDGGVAPAGIDYVVRVRDSRGCEQTDTINIQPPVPLVLDPIANITLDCSDSEDGIITARVTGGQGAGTYFFALTLPDGTQNAAVNNGTDTFMWEDLKPGTYVVTVSDNLTCEATTTVIIDTPPVLTIDVNPTGISCLTANPNNIQVIPGGGIGAPYEFGISSDGGTTITFQLSDIFAGLPAGDYQFYVRDGNMCVSDASNTIQVRNPDPLVVTLDLSNDSIVCFSEPTGSIDAVATGGLGGYGYRVEGTDYLGNPVELPGPIGSGNTQTTSFFGDLLAGTYTYTTTSGDCVDDVQNFEIRQPTEFIIEVFEEPISCNGETDGSIRVTAVGGTAPYFYSLYNSAGDAVFTFLEDDIDNLPGEHTFENLPADIYRVEVEDFNGCPREEIDVEIIEPAPIEAIITATTPEDCEGDMNGTATVSITGGLQPLPPASPEYYWSIDGVSYQLVPDPTNLFIDNLPGGTTTLFIRDSQNSANCQGAFNIEITPGVRLEAPLVQSLICPEYDYSDPENPVMTTDERYFVTFDIDSLTRTLDVIYTIEGINGTPNPANNTSLDNTFEVTPGEYEGFMEFQMCRRSVGEIEVLEYTPLSTPVAQMTNNPQDPNEYQIIVEGGRQFDREPNYAYYFARLEDGMTIDNLDPLDYTELAGNIFVIRETADYVLRVVDAAGCETIVVQRLTYINIRIPNYFTPDNPNGNPDDRFWYPRQITPNADDPFFFENMEVMVFDRYGRMLAEFKGDQQGWDGMYQGKLLPSGDYWYTIILNDVDNREFTGHFTLYR